MSGIKRASFHFCLCCILASLFSVSCNKLVQIPNPISSVTAPQVFSSNATATAALMGIYSDMSGSEGVSFANIYTTKLPGESADELTDEVSGNEKRDLFLTNTLTSLRSSSSALNYFWKPAYFDIYSANAVIFGVQSSANLSTATRNQLTGEAKFIRAFCYFYLTNLFGDIPLVLTPDFNETVLVPRTPQARIYEQIVSDLYDAQNLMVSDFSLSNGQPIRANKWAAVALLARVYQYEGQWQGADSAASVVINSGQFSLVGLDSVFLANSAESILQLQTLNQPPYATLEGNFFIPNNSNSSASCWLTSQLLAAFEPDDQRRVNWVDSTQYRGKYYYYPYKYKIKVGSSWPASENYTLLRVAEQYLIRAEAEANLSQLADAIADVNTIRTRAGLDSLSSSLTAVQVLASIQQEYRIEFFAEWGHRWLDLRRWGLALQTLDTISYKIGNIDSTQLLYPIPMTEIQTDPNLTQNNGY
jgi:hypothetical protein